MCRLIRGGGGGMGMVEGAIVFILSKCCEVWREQCVVTSFCMNFCRILYVLFSLLYPMLINVVICSLLCRVHSTGTIYWILLLRNIDTSSILFCKKNEVC